MNILKKIKNHKINIFNILKFYKNTTYIINAIFCIVTLIIFKFNFIALAISFILSDIFILLLDKVIQKIIIRKSLKNDEDTNNLKLFLKEEINSEKSLFDENFNSNFIKLFHSQIEKELNKEKEKMEQLNKEKEDLIKNKYKNYDFGMDVLHNFITNYNELNSKYKKDLEKLYDIILEIETLVKKNPEVSYKINKTCDIFSVEIFKVIKDLEVLDENKKTEYESDFYKLINVSINYFEKIKESILNFDTNVDVTISALIKKIESEKEK